ncbi:protein translocase subunit SecD, partial [candidate division WWE3 bacterium CG_4_9_14_3_um_filter_34_6]
MISNFFKKPKNVLMIVLFISVFAGMIDLPKTPINIDYKLPEFLGGKNIKYSNIIGGYNIYAFNGRVQRNLEIKKGLDIAGGVSVLMEADMSQVSATDKATALDSLKNVIERRVNLLGISEATVQTSRFGENYRIIVELAGVFDTGKALDTIGQVAQLEFRIEDPENPSTDINFLPQFIPTDLNGADLLRATIGFNQGDTVSNNEPQIELQFNSEGTKKFKEITEANLNKRVAIYLDDNILIAPVVQSAILDGKAVISGQFTLEDAKLLVTQLNAGALPVPVKILEQRTVGPTLGQESVQKSIYAGGVGLLLVMAFMILYYGRLGILASIALIIYGLITLALYKIIPVVLTLPGLAGFILSIGMAVDANILIFERIKEELRAGRPVGIALENGFGRSWD